MKENPTLSSDWLFGCFLPYRESLNLSRWLQGLIALEKRLKKSAPISERLCYAASFNGRQLYPDLKPPDTSETEFQNIRTNEKRRATLTEAEKEEEMEQLSREIQKKLLSGELNLQETKPEWIPHTNIELFQKASLEWLTKKILPACNPSSSFLELATIETLGLWNTNPWPENQAQGIQRLLLLWDQAKIQNEGEPPYKIVFSKQVEEALGIDGELESLKLQKLRKLGPQEKTKYKKTANVATQKLPSHRQTISKLLNTILTY
jgi:hypothetical protein